MTPGRTLALVALFAVSLSPAGCIGMFIPKLPEPFNVDVPAGGLATVGAQEAVPEAPIVKGAAIPPALSDAPPPRQPERTNIVGAGDGAMTTRPASDPGVERIVVKGKNQELPKGAPDFSSEQIASSMCAAIKSGRDVEPMRKVHRATLAVEQARRDFEAGSIGFRELKDAEQKRQDALAGGGPIGGLFWGLLGKRGGLPKAEWKGVVLENLDLFTFTENGRNVMAVSGVARNTTAEARELPPVTLTAIDRNAFIIGGQSSLLAFETLAAGETKPFELRFHNPPANTREVQAAFAPPFRYRGRRDCDGFDPGGAFAENVAPPTENQTSGGPPWMRRFAVDKLAPQPAADAPADYTAPELYALMLYYRFESEAAWRCRYDDKMNQIERILCAEGKPDAMRPLEWRDMFAMSELLDEAWAATRASEAPDAPPTAEAARRVRIAAFRAAGDTALRRAGMTAPDLSVAMTKSSYGLGIPDGLYVEIAGAVENRSAEPRRIDALMVAAVDRFGLPFRTLALPVGQTLAPGQRYDFSRKLGIVGVLPREVSWQVHVGAMTTEKTAAQSVEKAADSG